MDDKVLEEQSRSPSPPLSGSNVMMRLKEYAFTEVITARADALLLTCCFISGLVDSTIYNAYGTFVSMQTGNTIFVGLGGPTPYDTPKPYGWSKSLLSISTFCLGCFFFSSLSRTLSPRRRSTLAISFLLQTLLILVTATLIQIGIVDGNLSTIPDDIDWWQMIPIALLSFQSAGQIVGSRALGLAEIPTVVLTSMIHDIATDPALMGPLKENVKRNRRVLAFFAILIGAIAGGFTAEKTDRMQVPLWIAGGIKLCVVGAWLVWPGKKGVDV